MNQNSLPCESPSRSGNRPDEVGASSNVTNLAADEFHFFLRFPLEIRIQIWERSCFIPRVLDIFSSGTGCEALHNLDDNFHDLFGGDLRVDFNATHCPPPAVLHTCQESRRVGLQSYMLAFGKGPFSATPPTSSNISFSCQINMPAHIYINWECDIVCPMGAVSRDMKDMEVQLQEIKASSWNMLRRLAIDPLTLEVPVGTNPMDSPDHSNDKPEMSWAQLLTGCPKLMEIILYHLPNNFDGHGQPLEFLDISEDDIEQGVGVMVPELKNVRDVILDLINRMEMSRKATDVAELSKGQEASVPCIVSIVGVATG